MHLYAKSALHGVHKKNKKKLQKFQIKNIDAENGAPKLASHHHLLVIAYVDRHTFATFAASDVC